MSEMDRRRVARERERARKARERRRRRTITISVLIVVLVLLIVFFVKACTPEEEKQDENPAVNSGAVQSDSGEEEEEPKGDPNEVVATANVLSTGDILIHQMLLDNSKVDGGYGFDKHFTTVTEKVKAADYAVANFEVTLGGAERGYSCYPCFNIPDTLGDALMSAGFDFLLTANNHCYDSSFAGLKRTVNTLRDMGFETTGTRSDLSQKKYSVVDVNGIKLGIVNYTYETTPTVEGRKALNGILMSVEAEDYVNSFHEDKLDSFYSEMEQNIADMKADGAEAIILYIHWGVEYSLTPNASQKAIAQKMCDLGVDAIIGGHPHVLQSSDVLTSEVSGKKTFCIYSVGNALSNQRSAYMGVYGTGHTEDGILVYTEFKKYGDGRVELSSVDYVPTWVNRYEQSGQYVYAITPLDNIDSVSPNNSAARESLSRTEKIVAEGFNEFNGT